MGTVCGFAQPQGQRDKEAKRLEKYKKTHPEKKNYSSIEWADYAEDGAAGGTLNYSKYFQIGVSGYYAAGPWFMCGLDVGVNLDNDTYVTTALTGEKSSGNYTQTVTSYDPKVFVTATPMFRYRYFAVGCGLGVMSLSKSVNEDNYTHSSDDGYESEGHKHSSSDGDDKFCFMLRPTVKGFIPLSDTYALTVTAGYDYAFDVKEFNGFNFGIGLTCTLDL